MVVSQYMNPEVVSIFPSATLSDVWPLIYEKRAHGVPVVNKDGSLLGIVAEEDLLARLFPGYEDTYNSITDINDQQWTEKLNKVKRMRVKKVMNSKVYFTRPETHIMRALSRMIVRKVRQLPVLDEENLLVGIISKADIFRAMFGKKTSTQPVQL